MPIGLLALGLLTHYLLHEGSHVVFHAFTSVLLPFPMPLLDSFFDSPITREDNISPTFKLAWQPYLHFQLGEKSAASRPASPIVESNYL